MGLTAAERVRVKYLRERQTELVHRKDTANERYLLEAEAKRIEEAATLRTWNRACEVPGDRVPYSAVSDRELL